MPYHPDHARGDIVTVDPDDWSSDQTMNAERVQFSIETDTSPFVGLMRVVDEIREEFSDDDKPPRGTVLEAIVFNGAFENEVIVEDLAAEFNQK
ncbi:MULTISPECIES: hypothetical protein [Halorubrum]|uniref:hypothetical protein n=1 Tax=Halorubrum TaxID=56688 RepID=UPI0010F4C4B1|nr:MULTISPECIES: hypothetical protein [Halorubrum]TKX68265.1 hypothetical protein EXE40_13060 [Halorubrum sp. GN11GM_10-3_MGM]